MEVSRNPVRTGALVRARRQRWRVSEVKPYRDCELFTLVGADVSNLGDSCQVISPFDLVEPVHSRSGLQRTSPSQWRHACRSLIAEEGDGSVLRTARQATINLLPFQLEPTLAVLAGLGSRVLLADEVGLGKTIQAALVLSELKARGAAERILILTPAGLRDQWSGELAQRFSLGAQIVDMRELRRRAAAWPVGTNPWSTIPIAIVSVDLAKRPEILPGLRASLWDVVVVDEAHGIGPGSDRREAVAALASAAPYVVLLTATPHSGDRGAFDSLCRLGDQTDALLVFRRSRRQAGFGGKRRKHRLLLRPTPQERQMLDLLAGFVRTVCDERGHVERDVSLALTTLQKRALSSAWSLERSVVRRLEVLARREPASLRQPGLPFDDQDGELDGADDMPAWTAPALEDVERERRLLSALAHAARAAILSETKLHALERLLRRLHARREQAIVFTEYRDTLLHVRRRLPYDCAVLHGGMARDARRAALDDFISGSRPFLLATDAAGEGLNLQGACRAIVNLELPWNPVRLEQRAGRVDRIGQRRTVHAFHLIARDTAETRILDRLMMRIATANEDIDAPDPLDSRDDSTDVTASGPAGPEPALATPQPTGPEHHNYERPNLQSRAWIEHVRLLNARRLIGPHAHPLPFEAAGPSLIAFTRRPEVRAMLGSGLLVVVRSTVEDACGRAIASHLTGALVFLANRRLRCISREELARLWPVLEETTLQRIPRSAEGWPQEAAALDRQFWRTRIQRETAIADAVFSEARFPCQPGLFEKRGLSPYLAWSDERRKRLDDLSGRKSGAERMAAAGRFTVSVALVLAP